MTQNSEHYLYGRPLATFGDSKPLYFKPLITFLNSFESVNCSSLNLQGCVRKNVLHYNHYPAIFYTQFLSDCNSNNSTLEKRESVNFKALYCNTSSMMAIKSYEQSLALWFIGSKAHLTHNKDHDCGSLFIEYKGVCVVGEGKAKRAGVHNTWLNKSLDLKADSDSPLSLIKLNEGIRKSNGKMVLEAKHERVLIFKVTVPPSRVDKNDRHCGGKRVLAVCLDSFLNWVEKIYIFDVINAPTEQSER